MSSVLTNLAALAAGLPKAEARVAAHVRRHPAQVPYQSVHAIARSAGVSVASVSRLARRLGYPGFREFKIALAQEVSSPVSAVYAAIAADDTDAAVVRKVFGGNMQSLQDTLKMLDIDACARAARIVAGARRVIFFGIGTSGNVGRDAALRFLHLDIPAEAHADPYEMLIQASLMKKGDVAIGISHSGRSSITVESMQLARKNGAITMGISNFPQSPLHRACDLFFCTSFPASGVRSSALSPVAAQTCLMDAIYVLAARRGKGASRVTGINKLIEAHFRMGGKPR